MDIYHIRYYNYGDQEGHGEETDEVQETWCNMSQAMTRLKELVHQHCQENDLKITDFEANEQETSYKRGDKWDADCDHFYIGTETLKGRQGVFIVDLMVEAKMKGYGFPETLTLRDEHFGVFSSWEELQKGIQWFLADPPHDPNAEWKREAPCTDLGLTPEERVYRKENWQEGGATYFFRKTEKEEIFLTYICPLLDPHLRNP